MQVDVSNEDHDTRQVARADPAGSETPGSWRYEMHPGFHGWWRGRQHAHEHGEHPGCGPRHHGHFHGEVRGAWAGPSFDEGGVLGVRRPLRFLAYKLELNEEQVTLLATVLDGLKTERAQAAVDQ